MDFAIAKVKHLGVGHDRQNEELTWSSQVKGSTAWTMTAQS